MLVKCKVRFFKKLVLLVLVLLGVRVRPVFVNRPRLMVLGISMGVQLLAWAVLARYSGNTLCCLWCCSYLRLKFSTPSEAARAIETVKEYKHEGQELTIKFFADDDSEGNRELYDVCCSINMAVSAQTWKNWSTRGILGTWKTLGNLKEFCSAWGRKCNKDHKCFLECKNSLRCLWGAPPNRPCWGRSL